MNEPNQSFVLYTNYYEILADLPNEKLGELFRAILEYKTTKKQPVVSVDLLVVFKFIKNQLDIDEEKYNKKRSKNSQNGRKGGAPKGNQNAKKQPKTTQNKHNDNDNVNVNVNDNVLLFSNENNNRVDFLCGDEVEKNFKVPRAPQKKIIKPSLKEISDYCKERNNDVNPERFLNYYEANGWKVGRNSMKDWKAAIRTWEGNCRSPADKKNNEDIDGWHL